MCVTLIFFRIWYTLANHTSSWINGPPLRWRTSIPRTKHRKRPVDLIVLSPVCVCFRTWSTLGGRTVTWTGTITPGRLGTLSTTITTTDSPHVTCIDICVVMNSHSPGFMCNHGISITVLYLLPWSNNVARIKTTVYAHVRSTSTILPGYWRNFKLNFSSFHYDIFLNT